MEPCDILDVGCGRGTIGKAIKTEYENKFRLFGVEVYEDYLNREMLDYYKNVTIDNFMKSYNKSYNFETILFVDVVEHFPKEVAIQIMEYFRFKKVIASIPNAPKHWEQAKSFEEVNVFERHLYNWTNEEVEKELGLKLVGENDGVGVFTNVQVN
jgi:SAM-dependent methyltransferase